MILVDTVGLNLLTNKASWKQIWLWALLSSRIKKSISTNRFLKQKKLKYWKIIQSQESLKISQVLKAWLKNLILNAKLLKIQFMNFLLILKKESLIPSYFIWEESMPLIIGPRHLSKIKELWLLKLALFSSELKLTTQKWKVFKQSLKKLRKSLIISWLFQARLLITSVF